MKEIEYTYINAYNNFLYFRQKEKEPFIILNPKDLINIDDALPDDFKAYHSPHP